MEIKILGTGCKNCKTLESIVRKVVEESNINAEIIKVDNIEDIIEYDIISTPGLVVDEKVVVSGRVPSEQEIIEFLTN
ncbi:MAG: TM0996/MTH895 family glutaredoxin-like protein [Bacteroidales bacterium]|nr:TM0996/MTH895 family glutaredoxin-like protein [Bacteroidales bacterium]MBN2756512.1 TM0996/MTH895 family glutaredoxin-like protein [Bacteroidales bacterium]